MSARTPAGMVDATTHLVLEVTRSRYGLANPETGLRAIESARIVASRVGRPAKLAADQVAVKVTIRVPVEVFDPLTPAALIVVPSDLVDRRPIEVDALDATDGAPEGGEG